MMMMMFRGEIEISVIKSNDKQRHGNN